MKSHPDKRISQTIPMGYIDQSTGAIWWVDAGVGWLRMVAGRKP